MSESLNHLLKRFLKKDKKVLLFSAKMLKFLSIIIVLPTNDNKADSSKRKAAKFVNTSAMDVILGPSPKIYIVYSDMKDVVIAHIN